MLKPHRKPQSPDTKDLLCLKYCILASWLPVVVTNGIALAHLLRKEQKTTLVFIGDGGTSKGDFHEAVNVASVRKLRAVFIIVKHSKVRMPLS